mgnify:CR=1 FL=1
MGFSHKYEDRQGGGFGPVEPGDYEVEVVEFKFDMTAKGNDRLNLRLKILPSGATCFEGLLNHEKCLWRIDTCLKALGRAPAVGETLDMDEAWAANVLIGARGWANIGKRIPDANGKVWNEVVHWITTKPASSPQPAAKPENLDMPEKDVPF